METKLEEIAAKARKETKLQFTSLCHHVTRELMWENLKHIPTNSATGIDGINVKTAKATFESWIGSMLQSVHNKGYKALPVRRVWIPKPGKTDKRPIDIPCIADRALQRSVSMILSAIYEQDFLSCSFGGRPKQGAHHALSTLDKIIGNKKVEWILEADLKSFFGSLDHGRLLQFVKHRVGDPRIINLIQRWLKAGIMEDKEIHETEIGAPQGGSISVLLSNVYLHYVLDLWFEKVVKLRLKGQAYLVRYIDDFIVCFEYQEDALKFQEVLMKRRDKFGLTLEPKKTRLVKFGREAQQNAKESGKKVKTIYFLGFTHYCTSTRTGKFRVGRKTEKSRLNRSITKLHKLMQEIRHYKIKEQIKEINQILRGHYAYYGIGGNYKSLNRIYWNIKGYWRKMLNSRSQKKRMTWEKFNLIEANYPLQLPKIKLTLWEMPKLAVL